MLAVFVLVAAACGGGDDSSEGPLIISADDDTLIELPDSDEVVELDDAAEPAEEDSDSEDAAEGSEESSTDADEAPDDTIPLAEEDGGAVALLDKLAEFNACLAREGHEFMGIPGQDPDPAAPSNQPAYLDALIKCNTETGIQQAFQESQAADANLTPEEIEERNEAFVVVVDCLRGKGWDIEDPVPNSDGLLQPSQDGFASPDGSINTDEITDCIAENNLLEGN